MDSIFAETAATVSKWLMIGNGKQRLYATTRSSDNIHNHGDTLSQLNNYDLHWLTFSVGRPSDLGDMLSWQLGMTEALGMGSNADQAIVFLSDNFVFSNEQLPRYPWSIMFLVAGFLEDCHHRSSWAQVFQPVEPIFNRGWYVLQNVSWSTACDFCSWYTIKVWSYEKAAILVEMFNCLQA